MKFRTLISPALALFALSALAGSETMDPKTMQARMQEAAALGPHHAALAKYIGRWDVEVSLIMPGQPPLKSKGTAEYSWVIEGRWLGEKITARLMGQPYESFSIAGYDNFSKNHVAVTVGSNSTTMSVVRGLEEDPKQPVIAMHGTLEDFVSGELHKPYKVVRRHIDDNRHASEIWEFKSGDTPVKVLEFVFTRKPQ